MLYPCVTKMETNIRIIMIVIEFGTFISKTYRGTDKLYTACTVANTFHFEL